MTDIKEISIGNNIYDVKVKNDHALKGYLDNGTLLTDAEGLNDVKYYNRSTFDLSKFTKVGTPTITDDGVASGFSENNDLLTTYNFNPQGTWEIRGSFVTPPSLLGYASTIITTTEMYGSKIRFYENGKIGFIASSDNSSYDIAGIGTAGAYALQLNTKYYFKWEFTSTNYNLYTSTDNINWTFQCGVTNSSHFYTTNSTNIRLGKAAAGWEIFTGSIDLKQFSITVDGKEVFNGNKSGIDTIKADNYTVVGNPTISSDGVASGFSSSSYLNIPANQDIDLTKPFNLSFSFNTNTTNTEQYLLKSSSTYLWIYITSGNSLYVRLGTTTWGSNIINASYNSIAINTDYKLDIEFTGTAYNVSLNDNQFYTTSTTSVAPITNMVLNMGYQSGSNWLRGSIDLNSFKIYVDGNLVYQPCLKIPYNQSKTGCKVVDSYYRDRVQDMYEQYGNAPYYTLSNTNFTLPMGEIYGLMGQANIVETYNNGASWYRVYSDGWCEQGGGFGSAWSGTQDKTITFIKPFSNTNYQVSGINSATTNQAIYINGNNGSKTTTQITFSGVVNDNAWATWEAKGYIS